MNKEEAKTPVTFVVILGVPVHQHCRCYEYARKLQLVNRPVYSGVQWLFIWFVLSCGADLKLFSAYKSDIKKGAGLLRALTQDEVFTVTLTTPTQVHLS